MGSHQIDFIRWIFGEIVEVSGQLRTAVTERPDAEGNPHHCTAEDGFALTLRSEHGVSVVMNSSSAAPVNVAPSMLVIGSLGIVEETRNRVVVRTPEGDREVFTAEASSNPLFVAMQRYAEVVRDAVHERHVPTDTPTFDDGLACSKVMDHARSVSDPNRP